MASELIELSLRFARREGMQPTAIPALDIIRANQRSPRVHAVYEPSVCFIAQGTKVVSVGAEVFRYTRDEFLFMPVDLPVMGEVTEATPKQPYLCLVLKLEPSLVFELASAAEGAGLAPAATAQRGVFVGKPDDAMSDAFLRLLRCLPDPADAHVMAPLVIREIVYRLLRTPYASAVRELGIPGSQTRRIAAVIDRLKRDFAKPLRAPELARLAGMSPSSFHDHFKRVTALSPLQYQKQLRLQEARRLLFDSAATAADVSFRVGYESPSQFSREYARWFGQPPRSDANQRLRATAP